MWCTTALVCILLGGVSAYNHDSLCVQGRTVLVALFEWRWIDIAEECENFLGPKGFCGVQISPPSENRVVAKRPWWERYQPVSYKLITRSGTEDELKSMIARCNKVGVKIYADIIINHMTGVGVKGVGTAGSSFDSGPSLSFPAVPYTSGDFNSNDNCHAGDGNVKNYHNVEEVRNCQLLGLADLRLGKQSVRGKVVAYMNHLIDLGVAGFRVGSAKHMWPADLKIIFSNLKNARSDMHGQNKKPFAIFDVPEAPGEPIKTTEYTFLGKVSNIKYGHELGRVFRRQNAMKWLKNWGEGWGMMTGLDSLNFIDNYDTERAKGTNILTYKDGRNYKMAVVFMLAHPYGFSRLMSSYQVDSSKTSEGPPHDDNFDIKAVSDDSRWIQQHRWRQISNMVAFSNMAGFSTMSHFVSKSDYQIAFARTKSGFVALNLEYKTMQGTFQTTLPAGTYCDVITGDLENNSCTGKSVTVDKYGNTKISVCGNCDNSMLAIHIGAMVGKPPKRFPH